jgi:hypothetical protein
MKIAVLGLGASLAEFTAERSSFDVTIGVNDIWAHVPADYVVCLDMPDRFTPERLQVINACRPRAFYSQLDYDDKKNPVWIKHPNFVKIELQPAYPTHVCQLQIPALPRSHCSPFVAAAIAYKLHGATEIHIYGVDLVNHPHLKPETCQRIKLHFTNLRDALLPLGCTLKVHGDGLLRAL